MAESDAEDVPRQKKNIVANDDDDDDNMSIQPKKSTAQPKKANNKKKKAAKSGKKKKGGKSLIMDDNVSVSDAGSDDDDDDDDDDDEKAEKSSFLAAASDDDDDGEEQLPMAEKIAQNSGKVGKPARAKRSKKVVHDEDDEDGGHQNGTTKDVEQEDIDDEEEPKPAARKPRGKAKSNKEEDDKYPTKKYQNPYIAMRVIAPKNYANYTLCRFLATGEYNKTAKNKTLPQTLTEQKEELERTNPEAIKEMIEDYQKSLQATKESDKAFEEAVKAWTKRNPEKAAAREEEKNNKKRAIVPYKGPRASVAAPPANKRVKASSPASPSSFVATEAIPSSSGGDPLAQAQYYWTQLRLAIDTIMLQSHQSD